jgi:hypothetical protein
VKKARAASEQVKKWKDQEGFKPEQVITLKVQGNPKRAGAALRFNFYKDGMTVAQYQETMKSNGGTPKLAMADMRWDFAKGYIDIK